MTIINYLPKNDGSEPEVIHYKCFSREEKLDAFMQAVSIIGGKWRAAIVIEIYKSRHIRYNTLKRKLPGITNIVLTRALKELEEQKVVTRIEFDEVPPHVEYALTHRGFELIPCLLSLSIWGERYYLEE